MSDCRGGVRTALLRQSRAAVAVVGAEERVRRIDIFTDSPDSSLGVSTDGPHCRQREASTDTPISTDAILTS